MTTLSYYKKRQLVNRHDPLIFRIPHNDAQLDLLKLCSTCNINKQIRLFTKNVNYNKKIPDICKSCKQKQYNHTHQRKIKLVI